MSAIETQIAEILDWADTCFGETVKSHCESEIAKAQTAGELTLSNFDEWSAKIRQAAIDKAYGGDYLLFANSGNNRTCSE